MTSSNISITILVDNHAGDGLAGEHGLSMWIEADGKNILFDTGQSGAFEKNARILGVDLNNTNALVLSHGHYDHTGGLPQALRKARHADVYCHPGVVRPRYSIRNGTAKAIQMPRASMVSIDALSFKRLHWIQSPMMLSDSVGITGPIPRETDFEDTGGPFYLDTAGDSPDLIDDDLALFIRTDQGIVVCVGCCHAGVVNTLRHIRRVSETEKIRAVIGGLHLINAENDRIEQTIEALRFFSPDILVPCHCTGDTAVAALREAMGDRVVAGAAGMTFRF